MAIIEFKVNSDIVNDFNKIKIYCADPLSIKYDKQRAIGKKYNKQRKNPMKSDLFFLNITCKEQLLNHFNSSTIY